MKMRQLAQTEGATRMRLIMDAAAEMLKCTPVVEVLADYAACVFDAPNRPFGGCRPPVVVSFWPGRPGKKYRAEFWGASEAYIMPVLAVSYYEADGVSEAFHATLKDYYANLCNQRMSLTPDAQLIQPEILSGELRMERPTFRLSEGRWRG